MISKIFFFIKNFFPIVRHLICDRRYSRKGIRKFQYFLSEEIPTELGGGYKLVASPIIEVDLLEMIDMWDSKTDEDIFESDKITYTYFVKTAWEKLKQNHQDSLIKCSHLKSKEVI